MDMDDAADVTPLVVSDPEMRELLGLFDAPAFARRGAELEYGLACLNARCERERQARLDMVRLRLRQWAAAAPGPQAWREAFTAPIDELWALAGAEAPEWSGQAAPPRRLQAIARDLVASIERFNRRWTRFVNELDLGPINRMIEQYNNYYVIEKECCMGSARLAARHFVPRPRVSADGILQQYPTLPTPELKA